MNQRIPEAALGSAETPIVLDSDEEMAPSQPMKKQRIENSQVMSDWGAPQDVGPSRTDNPLHSVRKGQSRSNAEETLGQAGDEMPSTWFGGDDCHDAHGLDLEQDPFQDHVWPSGHEAQRHEEHRGQKRQAPSSRDECDERQRSQNEEGSLGREKVGRSRGEIPDKGEQSRWQAWEPSTQASPFPLCTWLYSHGMPFRLRGWLTRRSSHMLTFGGTCSL